MSQSKHPDPTPAEIRKQCARIRLEWSEQEHQRRAGVNAIKSWVTPAVSAGCKVPDTDGGPIRDY